MSKIIICGDTLPTQVNMKAFEEQNTDVALHSELYDLLKQADFRIANVEGCFIDGGTPILKSGPNLKASSAAFAGFEKLGFNLVGLANNHALDYGTEGLYSTIELLNKAHIAWCGAGKNAEDASEAYITTIGYKKVGVIAVAEYEFTIATDNAPGAACFDDLETPDYVNQIKKNVDYMIVLYHGGKEYYRYPTPYVQKRCRKLIDKGADLVITQHSHCIGCMESYHDGTIVYGQGNFLFSLGEVNDFTKTGLILTLDTEDASVKYNVVIRSGSVVRLANDSESKIILDSFYDRSDKIKNTGFIEAAYSSFAKEKLNFYQNVSVGKIAAILEKLHLLKLVPMLFEKRAMVNMLNVLRCEAHRDLYIQGMVNKINNK